MTNHEKSLGFAFTAVIGGWSVAGFAGFITGYSSEGRSPWLQ